MSLRRLLLVSLTTFGLIALPGVASATSADHDAVPAAKLAAKSALKAPPYNTRISFLQFDKTRVYASDTVVRGQVLTTIGGQSGSIEADVTLQRRYQGSTTWATIRTVHTTNATAPRFTFTVRTNANAFYRVRFAGDNAFNSSYGDTKVSAYRKITTHVKSRQLVVYGNVAPSYTGKRMTVQRKTCASCSYKTVRTIKVKAGSKYQTTLTAPAQGRWRWRLVTKADKKFLASPTATIITRRL